MLCCSMCSFKWVTHAVSAWHTFLLWILWKKHTVISINERMLLKFHHDFIRQHYYITKRHPLSAFGFLNLLQTSNVNICSRVFAAHHNGKKYAVDKLLFYWNCQSLVEKRRKFIKKMKEFFFNAKMLTMWCIC